MAGVTTMKFIILLSSIPNILASSSATLNFQQPNTEINELPITLTSLIGGKEIIPRARGNTFETPPLGKSEIPVVTVPDDQTGILSDNGDLFYKENSPRSGNEDPSFGNPNFPRHLYDFTVGPFVAEDSIRNHQENKNLNIQSYNQFSSNPQKSTENLHISDIPPGTEYTKLNDGITWDYESQNEYGQLLPFQRDLYSNYGNDFLHTSSNLGQGDGNLNFLSPVPRTLEDDSEILEKDDDNGDMEMAEAAIIFRPLFTHKRLKAKRMTNKYSNRRLFGVHNKKRRQSFRYPSYLN